MTRQTGSIAYNFHEGIRSEYLAQYIFASFGTAVLVGKEDAGVDFSCTLCERIGLRAWPVAYFSVQVKSNQDPWEFSSEESVRRTMSSGPAVLVLG